MPRRPWIAAALRRQILALDHQRCASCRSPLLAGVPMVIEHIIPLVAGGSSTLENLCLSCYRCNEFKGPRIDAVDPLGGIRWLACPGWRELVGAARSAISAPTAPGTLAPVPCWSSLHSPSARDEGRARSRPEVSSFGPSLRSGAQAWWQTTLKRRPVSSSSRPAVRRASFMLTWGSL
jgi:hypothetical protein